MTAPSQENIRETLNGLIGPFNQKAIALRPETTFATDLELDSLTVMDLVAAIEDEFDIILPLNRLPDLETIDQLSAEVTTILAKQDS